MLLYASHFLDFWKTEANTALRLQNVCEATGYFWFGPLTIFFAMKMKLGPLRTLYFWLLWLFVIFSLWIFVPLPIGIGRFMALHLVTPERMLPAMGLINVAMLACFLTAYRPTPHSKQSTLIIGACALVVSGAVLFYLNEKFALALRWRYVGLSAVFFTGTFQLIRAGQTGWVILAMIIPIAATTFLVNPIGRGLAVVTKSGLHDFLTQRPDLYRRKWLVFSDEVVGPDYLSAHGLDVFNSFHAIPDLASLRKLDPEGRFSRVYNSAGYLIARAQPRTDIAFEPISHGIFRMSLTPGDPALRDAGITALAFRTRPPEGLTVGLTPLSDKPIDTFWLYEISR